MEYKKEHTFYAKEGEYVTLDGKPYLGIFHKMPSGALMTGNMHDPDSEVIVAINPRQQVTASPELQTPPLNTTLNENNTTYDLLPVLVNKPPVIIRSIAEASTPPIKSYAAAAITNRSVMFQFPDGTVKTQAGSSLTLRVEARQPDVWNVENGILEIKEGVDELKYRWTLNGETIVSNDEVRSLGASRIIRGNTLTITNMIPKYAGIYACSVINDIGSSEGGSVNLEVYNPDVDSYFYTNLIQNPNGINEDGAPSTDNWSSIGAFMEARNLTRKTLGSRDKSIAVDPMKPQFKWTRDMLFPRPYQIDGGGLKQNPYNKLSTYFTRSKYQYYSRGGSQFAQLTQTIDVADLEAHIKGAIYGVEGVAAMFACYIGMAIYNYETAVPFVLPNIVAQEGNYYNGAARLSLQNFIKMGPGFVKEIAYVDVEQLDNSEILKVERRITDPWNRRLGQYNGQVYYPGGENLANPDTPSPGDNRDKMLFVADELFPKQTDRYTFGQYAEFSKIVIPKLEKRTNKIRITFTIEAQGSLDFVLRENNITSNQSFDGIFDGPGWGGTYKSNTFEPPTGQPYEERNKQVILQNEYRTNSTDINERLPKQSLSRAFGSGFTLALAPINLGRSSEARNTLDTMLSRNTRVAGIVPSSINLNARAFDARDEGLRNLMLTFMLNTNTNTISYQLEQTNASIPEAEKQTLPYTAGIFPFSDDSSLTAPATKKLRSFSDLLGNPYFFFEATNGIYAPHFVRADSRVEFNANDDEKYNIDYQEGGINETVRVQYRDLVLDPPEDFTYEQTPSNPKLNLTPKIPQKGVGSYFIAQLNDTSDTAYRGASPSSTSNSKLAPRFPFKWYSITDSDRLQIYQGSDVQAQYTKWAIPSQPLDATSWIQDWNDSAFANNGVYKNNVEEAATSWKGRSRFIITLGVHNTNLAPDDAQGLYAIDNYYMDFTPEGVIIHKTPELGGVETLHSFDKIQHYPNTAYEFYNKPADTYEPLQSRYDQVFVSGLEEYTQDMVPIKVAINQAAGTDRETANFELPLELLTNSRMEGGLNIPITTTPIYNNTNVLQGSLDLANLIAQGSASLDQSVLNDNKESISTAISSSIASLATTLTIEEQNFINYYNFEIPHTDAEQVSIVRETDENGDEIEFERSIVPLDSEIIILARRGYALQQLYDRLIAQFNDPTLDNYTLPSDVIVNAEQYPIELQIAVDGGQPRPSEDYKVIIYGVRPATLAPELDDIEKPQGKDVTKGTNLIGTPLTGFDVLSQTQYTLQSIAVVNETE